MKRRGFLGLFAGAAAAIPVLAKAAPKAKAPPPKEITFGMAPVKREGAPVIDGGGRLTLSIDRSINRYDYSAFTLAHHAGGHSSILLSRAVAHQELEDCQDPLLLALLGAAEFEGVRALNAWEAQHLYDVLNDMGSPHVQRVAVASSSARS